jgi:TPR repeat protein
MMYKTGEGVKQDLPEALQWFKKAAVQGNAQAQYNIGTIDLSQPEHAAQPAPSAQLQPKQKLKPVIRLDE